MQVPDLNRVRIHAPTARPAAAQTRRPAAPENQPAAVEVPVEPTSRPLADSHQAPALATSDTTAAPTGHCPLPKMRQAGPKTSESPQVSAFQPDAYRQAEGIHYISLTVPACVTTNAESSPALTQVSHSRERHVDQVANGIGKECNRIPYISLTMSNWGLPGDTQAAATPLPHPLDCIRRSARHHTASSAASAQFSEAQPAAPQRASRKSTAAPAEICKLQQMIDSDGPLSFFGGW